MIKGILFDMDGVIVDSEEIHFKSYQKTFLNHNIDLTSEEYYDLWTKQGKGVEEFAAKYGYDVEPEKIKDEKGIIFRKMIYENPRLIEDADKAIKELSKKYRLALVSSSRKADVAAVLESTNLRQYFEVVVSRQDVVNKKPAPDSFLLATEKLGLSTDEVIVVEDAEKGIVAAYNGGIKSIAIPTEITRDNDFSKADKVLDNISQIIDSLDSI